MSDAVPDAADGFILLEILIAVAILAIVSGFAVEALSGGLDRLGATRAEQNAVSLAQATLARVGHDIPLRDGQTRGTEGRGLRWQLDITPYGDSDQPSWGQLAAHRVVVTVFWIGVRHEQQTRLTSLRQGPRETTP